MVFFCCLVRPAVAAPALWVVQSPSGGKVYLFGTVHMLRPDTQWRSPELEAAIDQSQDLYLEIADPANVNVALASLVKLGLDRDHPLSTKISKDDVTLLDAAAKRYGFAGEAAFEPMRPWLVAMMLSMMPALHSGYSTASGVDLQVRKEFAAAGKPIHGFETFDMQAHIFADLPETVQIALLDAELKITSRPTGAAAMTAHVDRLVDIWLSGDEDRLAAAQQMNSPAETETSFEAKILTDRNKAWASALAQRLKQPGTSFVCVGAFHLVGPRGVPALLAQMGYKVSRVPIAQITIAASPSPTGSVSPVSSASPSSTPVPPLLTPPAGWKPRNATVNAGALKTDHMWVEPNHEGVLISGHLELPGIGALDLDTLATLFRQGIIAKAGAQSVQSSNRVKICNGKQDGVLTKVALPTANEDIVLAVSDRSYIAEYIRRAGAAEDPAAARSLLSLCAP